MKNKNNKVLILLVSAVTIASSVSIFIFLKNMDKDNNTAGGGEKLVEQPTSVSSNSIACGDTNDMHIKTATNKTAGASKAVKEVVLETKNLKEQSFAGEKPHSNESVSSVVYYMVDMHNKDRQRVAIYELPGEKNNSEIQELANFLMNSPLGDRADYAREYGIRNAIMDVLREQTDESSYVISVFIQMYKNPAQGDVMQGYALQHLASICLDTLSTLSSDNEKVIIDTLHDALQYNETGTLAPTGLIGLKNISKNDSEIVSMESVLAEARALLDNSDTGFQARISALQVCGELGDESVAPIAEKDAINSDNKLGVRLASIYLLGRTTDNVEVLEMLSNDDNAKIRYAAEAALSKKEFKTN